MKLSSHTTSVLKNFATINQNLVIKEGNTIATMSAMKNIVAKAEVEENFPQEVAIYDLKEFLGALSLFTSPILEFNDSYVLISEETKPSTKMKYFYSDPSVVTSPNKMITMPSEEVKFTMSNEDLSKLKRAAGAIGAPDMVLDTGDVGIMLLRVSDRKNDSSNEFSLHVGETDKAFELNFRVENIKLLPGSYDVEISKQLLAKFTNSDYNLDYYIALEPDSSYE